MCGVGGVGQGPTQGLPSQVAGAAGPAQEPPSKVAGASGSPEQTPPSKVAGASGGGGTSDIIAQILAAVKSLESLIGGISGGGPAAGKPTQVGGDAGKGVEQIGQKPAGKPTQVGGEHGGGKPDQVGGKPDHVDGEHGKGKGKGKKFGKHDEKPGWGHGGFGPPGLMKKGQTPGQAPTEFPGKGPGQVGGAQGAAPAEKKGAAPAEKKGQVAGEAGPAMPTPVDPMSLVEVPAPEGAPTADKSGEKIRYFTHPGDPEPRPISEAMIKYFSIGA